LALNAILMNSFISLLNSELAITFLRLRVYKSYMIQTGDRSVRSATAKYYLERVTAIAVIASEPSIPEM